MNRAVGKATQQVRSIAVVAGICVFALALLVPRADATGTLDQQQTAAPNHATLGGPEFAGATSWSWAQTFTAGLTGALDQVDLHLARAPWSVLPLTVEIRNVSAGAPGSLVLATAAVPAADVPLSGAGTFVAIPFPVPAPVVAGTQYSIVAYAGGEDVYQWGITNTDAYAPGAAFAAFETPPSQWSESTGTDSAFKTYVTALPPPADGRVVICHKPGAKNEKTKEVPASAVPEHLAHGDTLGACE